MWSDVGVTITKIFNFDLHIIKIQLRNLKEIRRHLSQKSVEVGPCTCIHWFLPICQSQIQNSEGTETEWSWSLDRARIIFNVFWSFESVLALLQITWEKCLFQQVVAIEFDHKETIPSLFLHVEQRCQTNLLVSLSYHVTYKHSQRKTKTHFWAI